MNIGVIGLGLVGGSLFKFFAAQDEHRVLGFDQHRETIDQASQEGYQLSADIEHLATNSELIIVAVPPQQTAEIVAQCLQLAPAAIVADTASVKESIVDNPKLRASDSLSRYLPAHPLAGSEQSGWLAAHRYLLNQATWALCPDDSTDPEALVTLSTALESLGCSFVFCSAKDHDRITAASSHSLHILSSLLAANIIQQQQEFGALPALLSGGALRDMTRIAESDRVIWEDIINLNQEAIRQALAIHSQSGQQLAASPTIISDWLKVWERGQRGREELLDQRWLRRYWRAQSLALGTPELWAQLKHFGQQGLLTRSFAINAQGSELTFSVGAGEQQD